jgi:hypothetical protein
LRDAIVGLPGPAAGAHPGALLRFGAS